MLQALNMETTVAPVKNRTGAGSYADPADAVFAGMMAQASCASMTPPPGMAPKTEPGRVEPRTLTRIESPEARDTSQPIERSETTKPAEEPNRPPADPAKAAEMAPKPEKPAARAQPEVSPQTAASDTEPALQPQVPVSGMEPSLQPQVAVDTTETNPQPAAPALQAPPPEAAPSPSASQKGVSPEMPAPQAAKPVDQPPENTTAKGTQPLLPKGLEQKIEDSGPGPSRPALTELLYLPKVEIQTPKLNPEAAKTNSPDARKTIQINPEEAPGDAKTNPGVAQAPEQASDAEQKAPLVKTLQIEEAAAAALRKTESHTPQNPSQKMTAPSPDTPLVPPSEGLKLTAASQHVEATASARPSPVLAQVEGSIRWILQNKTQGAELQLHPESLGRVVIHLRVEGQEVHARLWTSEASSMAVLQDHKAALESSLKEQGLNLSSFDLHSGARGDGAQTASQEQAFMAALGHLPHLEVKQEMPIESAVDPLEPHQIEVYA